MTILKYILKNNQLKYGFNFNQKYTKIIYKNKLHHIIQSKIFSENLNEKYIKFISFKDIPLIYDYFKRENDKSKLNKLKSLNKPNNSCNTILEFTFKPISFITYKISPFDKSIKIFGDKFVKNNYKNFYIIYDDKIYPLKEYFYIDDIENEDKINKRFKIILIESNYFHIINFSQKKSYKNYKVNKHIKIRLIIEKENILKNKNVQKEHNYIDEEIDEEIYNSFYNSKYDLVNNDLSTINKNEFTNVDNASLSILSNYSKIISKNEENKSFLLYMHSSLLSLSDIYKIEKMQLKSPLPNISNLNKPIIEDLSEMFFQCISLLSISDISNFNKYKVKDISGMFWGCISLEYLPDLSKWDTSNVEDMSCMFNGCLSLISLPDISKWDTSNVDTISGMFNRCCSLTSIRDISKWDTSKAKYIGGECIFDLDDLEPLEDWTKIKNKCMNGIFTGCSSLISLPDISKWEISNVEDMSGLFSGCSTLISLPDISKWNITNCKDMHNLFDGCSSLASLPDISIWNTSKVINISNLFKGCSSLISLPNISKWNMNNLHYMDNVFNECSSLISTPNLTHLNSSNLKHLIHLKNSSYIFTGCFSLIFSSKDSYLNE